MSEIRTIPETILASGIKDTSIDTVGKFSKKVAFARTAKHRLKECLRCPMARVSRVPLSFILSSKNPRPEDKARLDKFMSSFRERSKEKIERKFPHLPEVKLIK